MKKHVAEYREDWLFGEKENKPIDTYIKGHLCIEQAINAILYEKIKEKPHIKNVLGYNFYKKIELLYILDVINSIDFNVLRKFNSIRNSLAHEIDYELELSELVELAESIEESSFSIMFDDNCIAMGDIVDIGGLLSEEILAISWSLNGIYDEICGEQ